MIPVDTFCNLIFNLAKINKIPKEILNKLFNDFMGTKELGVQESVVTLLKDEGYKISYGSIYRHIERSFGKR